MLIDNDAERFRNKSKYVTDKKIMDRARRIHQPVSEQVEQASLNTSMDHQETGSTYASG